MPKRYEMEWVCFVDAADDDWFARAEQSTVATSNDVGLEVRIGFYFHYEIIGGLTSEGWLDVFSRKLDCRIAEEAMVTGVFILFLICNDRTDFWPVR